MRPLWEHIYVPRDAKATDLFDAPVPFAEVEHGRPVHPGELLDRVRDLLTNSGFPFATQSYIVISMLGWLIRCRELDLPFAIRYIYADGKTFKDIPFDSEGNFLHPWPEEIGRDSIEDAGFYYRVSII